MTWQTMIDKAHGQLVTETDLDAIRVDVEHLGGLTRNGTALKNLSAASSIEGYSYDSDWFAVSGNTQYVKAHGLGALPIHVEIWVSSTAGGGTSYDLLSNTNSQSTATFSVDATNITIKPAETVYAEGLGTDLGTSGYLRIIAWSE